LGGGEVGGVTPPTPTPAGCMLIGFWTDI
jgi:hypothetical protein